MKRLATTVALVGMALGLVACEGQTAPATSIRATSATINLTGSANNGPAYSYFEYWKTATPAAKVKTPTRSWPAGAEGTFGERVNGLARDTPYTFRACGADAGDAAVCQPSRSFTTLSFDSIVEKKGSVLEFRGDPGYEQYVGAASANGRFSFTENNNGAIVPGAGCSKVGGATRDNVVTCSGSGIDSVRLILRDQSDTGYADLGLAAHLTVDGGLGNDYVYGTNSDDFLIGGLGADTFYAYGGNDTVSAREGSTDIDSSIDCGEGPGAIDSDHAHVDNNGELPLDGNDENCEYVHLF